MKTQNTGFFRRNVKVTSLWFIMVLVIITGVNTGCKRTNLDKLIAESKLIQAEKYCNSLEGQEQKDAYGKVAVAYLKDGDCIKAADLYAKAGDHIQVMEAYYRGDVLYKAESYCGNQTGEIKSKCAEWLANTFFLNGDHAKAIHYYQVCGKQEMAQYVSSKVPLFQLIEELKKQSSSSRDIESNKKFEEYSDTIRSYIYAEKKWEWKKLTDYPSDQQAVKDCNQAIILIRDEAAPIFIQKLKDLLSMKNRSEKNFKSLFYPYSQLDTLLKLVNHLHLIVGKRSFFTKYSLAYIEKGNDSSPLSYETKAVNYEEAFKVALFRTAGIFDTIRKAKATSDMGELSGYAGDLYIDLDVINYIQELMKNIEIRVQDIQRMSKDYRLNSEDPSAANFSEKRFWDFVAICNRVLYEVGKERFQEANNRLTEGYDSVKKDLEVR